MDTYSPIFYTARGCRVVSEVWRWDRLNQSHFQFQAPERNTRFDQSTYASSFPRSLWIFICQIRALNGGPLTTVTRPTQSGHSSAGVSCEFYRPVSLWSYLLLHSPIRASLLLPCLRWVFHVYISYATPMVVRLGCEVWGCEVSSGRGWKWSSHISCTDVQRFCQPLGHIVMRREHRKNLDGDVWSHLNFQSSGLMNNLSPEILVIIARSIGDAVEAAVKGLVVAVSY